MSGIREWLEELGLGDYAEAFEAERIDLDAARHLSDADLKELGLPMGPRRKLLAALDRQANEPTDRGDADTAADFAGIAS